MLSFYDFVVRIGTLLYKYVSLNLLFLIACVPIVTISSATAALFAVARKIVHEDEPAIFTSFWRAFRENYRQSSIIGVLFFLVCFLLWIDLHTLTLRHVALGAVALIFVPLLLLICLSMMIHIYPLMVHMRLTTRQLLVNAFKMGMVKPILTVVIMIVLGALFAISICIPILFFLFSFSVAATLTYRLIDKKFSFLAKLYGESPSEQTNT